MFFIGLLGGGFLFALVVCGFFTSAAAKKSFLLPIEQVLTFANGFVWPYSVNTSVLLIVSRNRLSET